MWDDATLDYARVSNDTWDNDYGIKKKNPPNTCYVLGTWTFTSSLNPCQPCERTDLIATFYLLTRRLRHRNRGTPSGSHSPGSEPRAPIPKPFSLRDLCSPCLLEVFPVCQSSDSLRENSGGGAWEQWSPFSASETHLIRPFNDLSDLLSHDPLPPSLCSTYQLPCFSMIS